jgi:hypothetical protein
MSPDTRDPHWVDLLFEKHECFTYDNPATVEVEHGGGRVKVLLPSYVPHAEVLVTAESGHLLFLIGRQTQAVYGEHYPVLMIAKRRDDGSYEVVVWHTLFTYAFQYLNLQFGPLTPENDQEVSA